jgi:hypothetical protein
MIFGLANMPVWLQQLAAALPLQQHWPSEVRHCYAALTLQYC